MRVRARTVQQAAENGRADAGSGRGRSCRGDSDGRNHRGRCASAAGEYFAGLMSCQLADQLGSVEGLGESEKCFAELLDATDFAEVYIGERPDASPESAAKFEDFMNGMFGCLAGAMEMVLEGAFGDAQPSE